MGRYEAGVLRGAHGVEAFCIPRTAPGPAVGCVSHGGTRIGPARCGPDLRKPVDAVLRQASRRAAGSPWPADAQMLHALLHWLAPTERSFLPALAALYLREDRLGQLRSSARDRHPHQWP